MVAKPRDVLKAVTRHLDLVELAHASTSQDSKIIGIPAEVIPRGLGEPLGMVVNAEWCYGTEIVEWARDGVICASTGLLVCRALQLNHGTSSFEPRLRRTVEADHALEARGLLSLIKCQPNMPTGHSMSMSCWLTRELDPHALCGRFLCHTFLINSVGHDQDKSSNFQCLFCRNPSSSTVLVCRCQMCVHFPTCTATTPSCLR
jgi:hypothetical protein